jgi:rare lipoprotein A
LWKIAVVAAAGAMLAACASVEGPAPSRSPAAGLNGTMRPYEVNGTWYRPAIQPNYQREGLASWYGAQFHNRRTADGEAFDMDQPSAAHTTLPLPCIVEVTNLENGRRLRVRVNDRGPFAGGRIIDLSRQGAKDLGFYDKGTARVRVRYIGPAPLAAGVVRVAQAPRRRSGPIEKREPVAQQVQAAAFADLENAERAAASLSAQGPASITPLDRDGVRLYRVVVACAPGEDAEALRGRIAAAGYPAARVIGGAEIGS